MKTAIPTPETDAKKFAVRYSISDETMVVSYLFAADLERQRDALLAALEAIHEAGRMSSQPRAVYCSLIAEDALETAIGVAALRESLAAAQTIPAGEARKCAKCGFNISEYAVGEILCGACLNDQPCALCGHSYEAHEPDMQCHDGEAHGNRCACRTFVPSGEKEGK